jgi:RNA polymerase sporulation-specific sigma factor
MLLKATQTFDPSRRKTFMRYFELILKRKFFHLIAKLPNYEINETACLYQIAEHDANIELPDMRFQSKLEQDVHDLHLIQGIKIKALSKLIGVDTKAIYNAIYRIKEKYKNML